MNSTNSNKATAMKIKNARKCFAALPALFLALLTAVTLAACRKSGTPVAIPDRPETPIADLAEVFTPEEEEMLMEAIRQFERSSCGELYVLTVPTTGNAPIEEFSRSTANQWEIGKGKGGGVLLTLAILDRRSRLEVSSEWEDVLTNSRCAGILESIMPNLRYADYAGACAKAAHDMEAFFPK